MELLLIYSNKCKHSQNIKKFELFNKIDKLNNGIIPIFRDQSVDMDMTYALFGSTPPDLNSAKEGAKDDVPRQWHG